MRTKNTRLSISQGKVIPYTKFEHFGIIRFLSYAADKKTNKQTDGLKRPTHAVGRTFETVCLFVCLFVCLSVCTQHNSKKLMIPKCSNLV